MLFYFYHERCRLMLWAFLLSLSPVILGTQAALAYTPESPEVQQMLERATGYLAKNVASGHEGGDQILTALALHKAGASDSQAIIEKAIDTARKSARGTVGHGNTYLPAICCIFLCDVDPERSREEIGQIADGMVRRQHPTGCWSYSRDSYEDTSQTQYGLLSLWSAHYVGIDVRPDAIERATRWLVQTQHPGGGWSYKPPGGQSQGGVAMGMASHTQVTHSMSAAGVGSLYVAAHLFGFMAKAKNDSEDDGLPPAVTRVVKNKQKEGKVLQPQNTNRQFLERAMAVGDGWFARNLSYDTDFWTFYYMYGLERYKSFQELVQGKTIKEPDWYNKGVQFLQKTQREDGSWKSKYPPASTVQIDTAFAVLFLSRSSQKSIKKAVLNEGVLVGGHGLPKNITNVSMKDGKVVTPQMVREMDEWLEMLEGAEDKEFDPDAMEGMSLDDDLTERTNQLERLRKLVSNEDWRARRVAVRTLATARELDNVPILIYALTDKDSEVPMYARDGLRFISRKFKGFGMPDRATPDQKQAAAEKWKRWYLSIRPDGEVLE